VRGVEFGNTPMPLGLAHARRTNQLFDTLVLTTIRPRGRLTTSYEVFAARTPSDARRVIDVTLSGSALTLRLAPDSSTSGPAISLGVVSKASAAYE
jgi:hypothetical protein